MPWCCGLLFFPRAVWVIIVYYSYGSDKQFIWILAMSSAVFCHTVVEKVSDEGLNSVISSVLNKRPLPTHPGHRAAPPSPPYSCTARAVGRCHVYRWGTSCTGHRGCPASHLCTCRHRASHHTQNFLLLLGGKRCWTFFFPGICSHCTYNFRRQGRTHNLSKEGHKWQGFISISCLSGKSKATASSGEMCQTGSKLTDIHRV